MFFSEPIVGAPNNDDPLEVLVSGTADFLVPFLVDRSLTHAGISSNIVVVDRCATPLEMCRLACGNLDCHWQLIQDDILSVAQSEDFESRFDLVVSDRLLGFFPPEERRFLADAWHRVLRPGGRVLTTASIHPRGKPPGGDCDGLLEEISGGFETRYRDSFPGMDQSDVLEMVGDYARQRSGFPVRSPEEVLPLMASAGFRCLSERRIRKTMESGMETTPERFILRLLLEKTPLVPG